MVGNISPELNTGNVIGKIEINFNSDRSIASSGFGFLGSESFPLYYLGIVSELKDYNIKKNDFKNVSDEILNRISKMYKIQGQSLQDTNTYAFDIKMPSKLFHGVFEMFTTLRDTVDLSQEEIPLDDEIISEVRIEIDFGQISNKEIKNIFGLAMEVVHTLTNIFRVTVRSYFFTNKSKRQIKNERQLKQFIEDKNLFYSEDAENYRIYMPIKISVPEFLLNIAKL